jgi:hypothetical protein
MGMGQIESGNPALGGTDAAGDLRVVGVSPDAPNALLADEDVCQPQFRIQKAGGTDIPVYPFMTI